MQQKKGLSATWILLTTIVYNSTCYFLNISALYLFDFSINFKVVYNIICRNAINKKAKYSPLAWIRPCGKDDKSSLWVLNVKISSAEIWPEVLGLQRSL
jgi:hypothetical protein